jgi:hypothetical protein
VETLDISADIFPQFVKRLRPLLEQPVIRKNNGSVPLPPASPLARVGAQLLLICVMVVLLGGCDRSAPVQSTTVPPSSSGLIGGDATRLVSAALLNVPAARVSPDDTLSGYLLTRIVAGIQPTATVAQFNAAAAAIGATRIAASAANSLLVSLAIPHQSSVAALRALATKLQAQPGIELAWAAREAKTSVLPVSSPGVAVDPSLLSNLLASRFPQAWNARQAAPEACEPRVVPVYVLDDFGDPLARPTFFSQIDPSHFIADPQGASPLRLGHGYDVASIVAGAFDGTAPTGANPFLDCVEIDQFEALGLDMSEALKRVASAAAGDTRRPLILNLSINFDDVFCGPTADQPCDATTIPITSADTLRGEIIRRIRIAAQWARDINATDLPQTLLLTQAVGNVDPAPRGMLARDYVGFRSAAFSSAPALATHLTELASLLSDQTLWKNPTDTTLPDVTFDAATAAQVAAGALANSGGSAASASNLLLIDSGTSGSRQLEDVQVSDFDFLGADIRAVAEDVPLADVTDPLEKSGTSFAAPQIAGLASYLWILSPELRAEEVRNTVDRIKQASRSTSNSTVPVIDALNAVLSLDRAGKLLARFGMLDVNGDGVFDHLDLQQFALAYGLGNPNTTTPSAPDYGRFDLNGDGFTGSILVGSLDLDLTGADGIGPPTLNSTGAVIEGYHLDMNEAALTDLQVLCYYAYALDANGNNLVYDSRPEAIQERTTILGPENCVEAQLQVTLPTITGSATLTAVVQVPAGNGQFAPGANLLIDLTATCASISPNSARTDANGRITAVVTPNAGCTSVSVALVARADPNAAPLAQKTVTVQTSGAATYAGTLNRTSNTTGNPNGSNSKVVESDIVTVSLTMQIDSTGKVSVIDAGGQRSINLEQPVPCFRPPNSTLDTALNKLARTDTLSGGNGSGDFSGIAFSPFLVSSETTSQQANSDCSVTNSHSGPDASNFTPSGINFSGSAILDAQGAVIGFDFNVPAETLIHGGGTGDIEVITYSGQLLRTL